MNLLLGIFLLINIFITGYFSDKILEKLDKFTVTESVEYDKTLKKVRKIFFILFVSSCIIALLIIIKDLFLV